MPLKKFLRNKLPRPESITQNRYLRFLHPWLGHPRLWHLNRRSVALGAAIGMVTGLLPAPFQILMAVVVSILLRANVLAAAFATLYTNPITFFPLYMLAYQIGSHLTGGQATATLPPEIHWSFASLGQLIPDMFHWISSLGYSLLIGLLILGALFSTGAYALIMIGWRMIVGRQWRNRHRKRSLRQGNP